MGKLNTASAECVCMNCTWAHRPKRDPVILVAPRPPERHMGLRSTVPQTKILEANVCLLRRSAFTPNVASGRRSGRWHPNAGSPARRAASWSARKFQHQWPTQPGGCRTRASLTRTSHRRSARPTQRLAAPQAVAPRLREFKNSKLAHRDGRPTHCNSLALNTLIASACDTVTHRGSRF